MPLMKRGPWPSDFQQGLAQPLPPYEPDPTCPGCGPMVKYPGSGPTIPSLPYPQPGWPAFTWPIVPMPGRPQTYPSQAPQAEGVSRAISALMAFLSGEGEDHESPEAIPNSRHGTGQCSKCRNR